MQTNVEIFLTSEKTPDLLPDHSVSGDYLRSRQVCFYVTLRSPFNPNETTSEWDIGHFAEVGGTRKPQGKRPLAWFGGHLMYEPKDVTKWFYLPDGRA